MLTTELILTTALAAVLVPVARVVLRKASCALRARMGGDR